VSPTIIGAPPDWAPNRDTTRLFDIHFNLIDDGLVGQQVFAAEATRLAYMTDEAAEGRDRGLLRAVIRVRADGSESLLRGRG
jgi:hypothetical protein